MKTYNISELAGKGYHNALHNTLDELISTFGVRDLTKDERSTSLFSAYAIAKHLGVRYNAKGEIVKGA